MSKQKPYFYRDSVKRGLWIILITSCILPILLEMFLHRHSHFADSGLQSMDGVYGFYALMGFFGCSFLILIAKGLGVFLKTDGRYYDGDL